MRLISGRFLFVNLVSRTSASVGIFWIRFLILLGSTQISEKLFSRYITSYIFNSKEVTFIESENVKPLMRN